MTLEPYDAEGLEQLTLRMLDLCARLRALARVSREQELPAIKLNDRKALEWIEKLEDWLYKTEGEVTRLAGKNQGAVRARQVRGNHPK